jgi:hypothetical protein
MPTLTPVSNPTASPSSIPTSPSSFPTATPTFSYRPSSSPTTVAAAIHNKLLSISSPLIIIGVFVGILVWPTSRNFLIFVIGLIHGYIDNVSADKRGYNRVPDVKQEKNRGEK